MRHRSQVAKTLFPIRNRKSGKQIASYCDIATEPIFRVERGFVNPVRGREALGALGGCFGHAARTTRASLAGVGNV